VRLEGLGQFKKNPIISSEIETVPLLPSCLLADRYLATVGVLLAADSQSTSKSGYRASLWDP
jgi:hypothetical protein